MTNRFQAFLAIFVVSCGFMEESSLPQEQASISRAVGLIKQYVDAGTSEITNVTVVNSQCLPR